MTRYYIVNQHGDKEYIYAQSPSTDITSGTTEHWRHIKQNNPYALELADRHYSRQTIGGKGFMPPARMCCLLNHTNDALWGTSWPYEEMTMHKRGDYWVCTIFRNESAILSSELIQDAVIETYSKWGVLSKDGFLTYVNPIKTRHKRDPGRCFIKAGWKAVDVTRNGLVVLTLDVDSIKRLIAL